MITKAEQHDIDREGRLLFTTAFQNINFVVNPTTDDYAIDYNVQAFDGTTPTGAWFHVQLKSTSQPSYIRQSTAIAYSLELDHLVHYGLELKAPVFLVLVDVTSRRVFFFAPQLAVDEIRAAQNKGQQSLAVTIPVANELPHNAAHLLALLKQLYVILSAREITKASLADFQGSFPFVIDREALYSSIQDKSDLLRLIRIRDAYLQGQPAEALRRASLILDDLDASLATKFNALIQINSMKLQMAIRSGKYGKDITAPNYEFARQLKSLATPNEHWPRLAGMIIKIVAEIEDLVLLDASDYMALEQHIHAQHNLLAVLGLLARRTAAAKRILRKYNQAIRLARLASQFSISWMLASVLPRIPLAIAGYLVSLRSSSEIEVEGAFIASGLSVLRWAFEVAHESGNEQGMGVAATAALSLSSNEESEAHLWCVGSIQRMAEGENKDAALESVHRCSERRKGTPQRGDYNPDTGWQIVQKLAFSMNVDISDEESPLVRRLRIAMEDDKPEQQMRFCEHVVVTLGAISPIARFIEDTFGIGSSSSKVIHCNLLNLHERGFSANAAFLKLKSLHCEACQHQVPRSTTWTYTPEVREVFQRENMPFVMAAASTGYGPQLVDRDELEMGQ